MFDINYLAIFNEQTGIILGHIEFDVSPNKIPPALGQTKKPGWWFDQEFDNSYQTSPPPFLTPPTRYVLGMGRVKTRPEAFLANPTRAIFSRT